MPQDRSVESELDDMVLSFEKYIEFKEKFDPRKPFSSEEVKLNDILALAEIPANMKTDYSDAFSVLLKHIHNDGLFYYGNNEDACKYINYILYKKVEVEHDVKRSYDETLSDLFKIFLDAYGKKVPGRKNRCISNIYNIQRDTFNKINALYDVYDKYKDCRSFGGYTLTWGCPYFKNFFDSYNNYMRDTYSKSPKFNDILKNIEKKAIDIFEKFKSGCDIGNYYIRSPHLFKTPPEQKPENHNQAQMSQTQLKPADSMLHSETPGRTRTPQTDLTSDISKSQQEQVNQGRVESNSAIVDHSADDSYRSRSHVETIDSPIRADERQTQMFSRFPEPFGHSYSSGTSLYSGRHGQGEEQATSKEAELSPSSVMNTITGVLGFVEPGPVLGVSGGMGVLFLLFKYTPVGSFFGGRKGRFRQIPRSFNGPFPGDFSNFQDYDGGFIGYGPTSISSLAE